MTSTPYLNNYMESLEYLPSDLQRNFNLMLELDSRAQLLLKDIDEKSSKLMSSIACDNDDDVDNDNNSTTNKHENELNLIKKSFNLVNEYSDDKVQLANQSYELVDKYIRKLDVNLLKFEKEIEEKYENILNGKDADDSTSIIENESESIKNLLKSICMKSPSSAKSVRTTSMKKTSIFSPSTSTNKRGRKKIEKLYDGNLVLNDGHHKNAANTENENGMLHMAVDPNEPTYCLCGQVSYGEMIGCDNSDCLIEWFHFPCVGLCIKPKGKWFCPNCK